jgi:hypothetical protein
MATQKTANTDPKADALPNFDEWTDEQIGFAPYWKPAPGKSFYGAPVAIDMRDPAFIRYQFMALDNIECQRGPADEEDPNAEKVVVKKGETFSVSVYHATRDLFDQYLQFSEETLKPVPVQVIAVKTVKTANQPKCWQFRARTSPPMRLELDAWRAKNRKFLAVGTGAERPQMTEAQ